MTSAQAHDDPWRNGDRTFLELCFDGWDATAPAVLRASAISEGSMGSGTLELMALTLARTPIYQGAHPHPAYLRSILVEIPGTQTWARIDLPQDLRDHIEVWRPVPVAYCTRDDRADLKILRGQPVAPADCPDVGLHAAMKVASGSEHSLALLHLRARGPRTSGERRGCRMPEATGK